MLTNWINFTSKQMKCGLKFRKNENKLSIAIYDKIWNILFYKHTNVALTKMTKIFI